MTQTLERLETPSYEGLPQTVPYAYLASRLNVSLTVVGYRVSINHIPTQVDPRDRRKRVVSREDAIKLLRVYEEGIPLEQQK